LRRIAHGYSTRFTIVILTLATLLLIADAHLNPPGELDYRVIHAFQELDLPHLDAVLARASVLTAAPWTLAGWAIVVGVLIAARRWLAPLVLLAVPVGTLIAMGVGALLTQMSRPSGERLHHVRDAAGGIMFPSGGVVATVLVYGLLFFLVGRLHYRPARLVVQVVACAAIVLAGVSRIWLGSHWPTEVLAGYALGGLMLALLIALYQRLDATVGALPFLHSAPIQHDESCPHTHALTSTILFHGDTVAKIYNPGFVPRALYWVSFQAPFPYMRNEAALRAAMFRRNLVGMLTEYWYGTNRVARALGIERVDGRQALVSEFVDGAEPPDLDAARHFLHDLSDRFDEVGLPTWQIDPRQPRSLGNVLATADGGYKVIDLESGIVSPLASPRAWWRALRRGLVPLFDDVYFDLTRAYVEREAESMRARLGDGWLAELRATIDQAEAEALAWHRSEPRIWGRFVRGLWTGFGIRTWPAAWNERLAEGQARAAGWIETTIATWETEERITPDEAGSLRVCTEEPQFKAVLPHFGVHLGLSVVLRFPFGSIARAVYTLVNLVVATLKLLLRSIDRHAWRLALGIHSPLVMLMGAVPGFGAFAYLGSRPVRSNHLLIRVGLDTALLKVPWRLYERCGLRRLVARSLPRVWSPPVATPLTIAGRPTRLVTGLVAIVLALFVADVLVQTVDDIFTPDALVWEQVVRVLDQGSEASLPTWFTMLALTACAGLLGLIGYAKLRAGDRFAKHWLVLGLLVLGISADEQVQFHDAPSEVPLRDVLGVSGWLYEAWVIPALVTALVVGLIYLRFLRALPSRTRNLMLMAAALYISGAVGLEMVAGWFAETSGKHNLTYYTFSSVEETLEMLGVITLLHALLAYVQTQVRELRVVFSEGRQHPGESSGDD
jgi:membrane-associated phospholipid phosphatase